ncbi:hypothetical protein [Paenibacillus sp. yr247]|uniref:glucosamine inositolphosphorylceramide transferase family protein n=1 Tax=Paenibacillus sp. yr247 TaxID=1761880 RepID=UPI00114021F6|nr:hypothetical protein [Paenibacillus sp. yr247]
MFKSVPKLSSKSKRPVWSISIYKGNSPFGLSSDSINNPVLTAEDVIDVPAEFIADPFMIRFQDQWHMFFEVYNKNTGKGCIGLASSQDGVHWEYQQIVILESFHMSYPNVFMWKDELYMIPETCETNSIRLYKSTKTPTEWEYLGDIMKGYFVDSTIFEYNDKLWMFTRSSDRDKLRLYFSEGLLDVWHEHPMSPIVMNKHIARPSGKVVSWENRIYRFTQDIEPYYGKRVNAFEITKLTISEYKESKTSFLLEGTGHPGDWNADGMHHIDAHQLGEDLWLACVDGHRFIERNKYLRKIESMYVVLKFRISRMFKMMKSSKKKGLIF